MILQIGGNSKGGNMKKEEALKIYNALSEKNTKRGRGKLFKYLAKHRKKRAVRFGGKPEG